MKSHHYEIVSHENGRWVGEPFGLELGEFMLFRKNLETRRAFLHQKFEYKIL